MDVPFDLEEMDIFKVSFGLPRRQECWNRVATAREYSRHV